MNSFANPPFLPPFGAPLPGAGPCSGTERGAAVRGDPTGLPENDIQRAVFKHIKTRGAAGVFAFHPKNGGVHQRGRRAGINTGLGVIAGVPDVIILWNGKVFAMELKTIKGKVSDDQKTVMASIGRAGAFCFVAFGLDSAISWLEHHGILRGTMR